MKRVNRREFFWKGFLLYTQNVLQFPLVKEDIIIVYTFIIIIIIIIISAWHFGE
jgi:hypothetical protein